jgi:hypothetical protein
MGLGHVEGSLWSDHLLLAGAQVVGRIVHHLLHLHLLELLHLLVHALHLDETADVATSSSANSLALAVDSETLNSREATGLALDNYALRGLCILLLHVVLQVVENSVEIDGVQLHWDFGRRVLRVVDHGRSFLSVVHLAGFDPVPLLDGDLLAVEHDEVRQLLDDVQAVLGFPAHGVVHQRDFHQVDQLSQPVNFPEFGQSVAASVECLQSFEPLHVGEGAQAIFLEFQARDDEAVVETVGVDLPDPVLAEVQFPQLLELVEIVDLGDFVVGGVEDLEVLHRSEQEPVQIVQTVVAHVEHFQPVQAGEPPRVVLLVVLAEERLQPVVLDLQNSQRWQVAEASQTGEEVVREVELAQVRAEISVEHFVEVSELAAGEVQFFDAGESVAAQPRLENLLGESSREGFLGFHAFGVLDAQTVEHSESAQVEDAVDSVVLLADEVVAGNVEDDEALQLLEVDDLLDVVDLVVAQVQFHQRLHVVEPTQSRDLVIFQTELGQTLQLINILNPLNSILAKVELLQILEMSNILNDLNFVLFQTQFL